jgi:predicted dehydrogenase
MNIDRRHWMTTNALAAGALTLGAGKALSAENAINIGLLGTGGRCRHLLKALLKVPGVKVTALADVQDAARAETRKLLPGQPSLDGREFKAVLDRKDIDAVLIASADHWHVPMTVAALEAGKHVYVEKPLTHTVAEGQPVIDAESKAKKVVQVGMQQRSMPHIREAKEMLASGKLGTVNKITLSWNRNSNRFNRDKVVVDPATVDWKAFLGTAPDQPLDGYKMKNWRWFWDFGGGIFTDLMVHWIDVAHWLTGKDTPEKAVAIGDFVNAKGVWETPDSVQCLLSYPGGVQTHFEGTFSNARQGSRIEFMTNEGTVYLDRGRFEFFPDHNKKLPAISRILGQGRPGADFYDQPDGELLHLAEWVGAIREGKPTSCPAKAGVLSAAAAHLANKALRGTGVATA